MRKLILALSLASAFAPAAFAQSDDEMTEIRGDKPITLRGDRAYFLFRSNASVSPVFLRIPTDAEMQAYDAARREAFTKVEHDLIRKRQSAIARKDAAEKAGQKDDIAIPPVPTLEAYNFVYDKVKNAQRDKRNADVRPSDRRRRARRNRTSRVLLGALRLTRSEHAIGQLSKAMNIARGDFQRPLECGDCIVELALTTERGGKAEVPGPLVGLSVHSFPHPRFRGRRTGRPQARPSCAEI